MNSTALSWKAEVADGKRFRFGRNWERFVSLVDDGRIAAAERALEPVVPLAGKTFLDVGSGSGLFSLAARRLGATVHSFDYDADSVRCTASLRARYYPEDPTWIVEHGSVLDLDYLGQLGTFDVVYSWGVLHHTGAMWTALENVGGLVKPGGKLFVSIYNDQGWKSVFWRRAKRVYNALPSVLRPLYLTGFICVFEGRLLIKKLPQRIAPWSPRAKAATAAQASPDRGMSWVRDWVDWIGGYPFEVATPELVTSFYLDRDFALLASKKTTTLGCNEFVFAKKAE
jgi:2-polyprenyl-3-methyl-5-hydroxy-6-metoxy-1,4-benzoquinol methylase